MTLDVNNAVDNPVDDITDAVITASRLLEAISARCLAEVDESITVPQFRALLVLSSHGPANLATLASRLDVQPSTIGRMIERLVAAGFINRRDHPTSRRELVVDLNRQGRKVVNDVLALRHEQFTRLVTTMPPKLQKGLVTGLIALCEASDDRPEDFVF